MVMRKIFTLPVLFLSAMGFQSCSKESPAGLAPAAPAAPEHLSASIAPNASYQLSLDQSSEFKIHKQAAHYLISKTEMDSKTNSLVYRYTPVVDFVGSDEVVISKTKMVSSLESNGCRDDNRGYSDPSYNTSYITIKIKVGN